MNISLSENAYWVQRSSKQNSIVQLAVNFMEKVVGSVICVQANFEVINHWCKGKKICDVTVVIWDVTVVICDVTEVICDVTVVI